MTRKKFIKLLMRNISRNAATAMANLLNSKDFGMQIPYHVAYDGITCDDSIKDMFTKLLHNISKFITKDKISLAGYHRKRHYPYAHILKNGCESRSLKSKLPQIISFSKHSFSSYQPLNLEGNDLHYDKETCN